MAQVMYSFVVQIEMKEVDRLAAVVACIQEEAAAVPKGAYMQTEAGKVVPNNSFHGLSLAEASHLSYYLHFSPEDPSASPPSNVCTLSQLYVRGSYVTYAWLFTLQDIHKLFEFQKSIEADIPTGE